MSEQRWAGRGRGRGRRVGLVMGLLVGLVLGAAATAPLAAARLGPLTLNQHAIEDGWMRSGAFTWGERARVWGSAYRAGLRRLSGAWGGRAEVSFDDPASVFAYVFANIPPLAVVYPTETYYYYRFELGDRRVSGNIRLLDAADGVLHIGYFDVDDRTQMRSATLGAGEGVRVRALASNRFEVTSGGREVEFVLPERALARPARPALQPYERFVSGVLDESGWALTLVYSELTKGFYFLQNEDIPAVDELVAVEGCGPEWLVGRRSRFLFYDDREHGRRVLVAVSADAVEGNTSYDGPFDQVPPRLAIKEMVEAAYPYTKLRGGIDEHGNFKELPDQRVAISPYRTYDSLRGVVEELSRQAGEALVAAERWNRLTFEPKRAFSPAAEVVGEAAPVYLVQGWPANHWGYASYQWPGDHRAALSGRWPANHESVVSGGAVAGPASDAGPGGS